MARWRAWCLVGLAALTLIAGCGAAAHPAPAGPSFERDDFRFVAPTGWEVRSSTSTASGDGGIVVYLANQALRDDCVMSASGLDCHMPIDTLRPGGMLVTWAFQHCVADGCDLPAAQVISIGNRQGVRVPATEACRGIGTTEGSVYYVTVTPQRVDALFVCARNPSDGTRAALLGLLDAIQWRIP
jgi:hypothetical protein